MPLKYKWSYLESIGELLSRTLVIGRWLLLLLLLGRQLLLLLLLLLLILLLELLSVEVSLLLHGHFVGVLIDFQRLLLHQVVSLVHILGISKKT